MRVIIDTNVFLSGIFWSGNPGKILDAWGRGDLTLILSQEVLQEYLRVGAELSRKYPRIDLSPFIDLLMMHAEFYEPTPLETGISRDPDDDKFIALAIAAKCPYIITGDNDLLSLRNLNLNGLQILKPSEFVKIIL